MKNSHKTAINHGLSRSAKWIVAHYVPTTLLDFGAGKLRNSKYLAGMGFDVYACDTPIQTANWDLDREIPQRHVKGTLRWHWTGYSNRRYPLILCSYVLNVVPPEEQNEILLQIKRLSSRIGTVVFEVRTEKDVLKAKTAVHDGLGGYFMKSGTYQFPFTEESLRKTLQPFFREVTITKGSSLMAVCR